MMPSCRLGLTPHHHRTSSDVLPKPHGAPMRKMLFPLACFAALSAQEHQRGRSLDAALLRQLQNPKWNALLNKVEANAEKAEALAAKTKAAAQKAKEALVKAQAKAQASPSDPAAQAAVEAATKEQTQRAQEAADAEAAAKAARETAKTTQAQVESAASHRAMAQSLKTAAAQPIAPQQTPESATALQDQAAQEEQKAKQAEAPLQSTQAQIDQGSLPSNARLLSGLVSPGVTIHTYFGTRWSNLYRDPQANDTFFRPKGFFAVEHEQYFWLQNHPMVLMKWGGGAMIQGAKESDFQETQTQAGFKKAVNATDVASANGYVWLGGFITDTTSIGLYLQHQFSNYTQYAAGPANAPTAVTFSDVIRSQRRLGIMVQQHDEVWRGSLLEYSICADPLFEDSRNRQFIRGRAMYNFDLVKSLGFYLEGSINRGRSATRDRDDATITLGFRVDLRVLAGN